MSHHDALMSESWAGDTRPRELPGEWEYTESLSELRS